ncbi:MAG: hypothetical protein M0Z69_14680 [Actinomycetota bacterium]|nr:hypothetical protein [Actinomycetota bacterium]
MNDKYRYESQQRGIRYRNGRWQVRYRDEWGREKAQSFETHEQAELARARLVEARRRGAALDPRGGDRYFRDEAEDFLERREQRVRRSTFLRDEEYLDRYIMRRFGPYRLRQIDYTDVDDWLCDLGEMPRASNGYKPLSNATRYKARTLLKQVFGHAVQQGRLERNPVDAAMKVPGNRPDAPVTPPPADAVERLQSELRQMGAVPNAAGLTLVTTGIRIGELLACRVGDVDLEQRALSISRTWSRDGDDREAILETTKTPRSKRRIPLITDDLERALRLLDLERPSEAPLLPTPTGVFWTPGNFRNRVFKVACERAAIAG